MDFHNWLSACSNTAQISGEGPLTIHLVTLSGPGPVSLQ